MDPTTLTAVSNELIKQGILGLVIVVLMFVAGALWKQFMATTQARMDDNVHFQDRFVGMLEKQHDAAKDTNAVLEVIKERVNK